MAFFGNPFIWAWEPTSGAGKLAGLFLFPMGLCAVAYAARAFLRPTALKLVAAVVLAASARFPVLYGDDFVQRWKIGPGTRWESFLTICPAGFVSGHVTGSPANVVAGILNDVSRYTLYGFLCYLVMAVAVGLATRRLSRARPPV